MGVVKPYISLFDPKMGAVHPVNEYASEQHMVAALKV